MIKMRLLKALLFCPLLFLATGLLAQTKNVTGKITDEKGTAIPGATVQIKGTSTGTVSNTDGVFSLSAPSSAILVVSFIGYASQEVNVAGKTEINVSLVPENTTLTDVVVVGYGIARKKDLTGAVASLKAKDFNKGITNAPDQLIQGKVAGLMVVNNNGAPGAATTVRIRGIASVRSGNQPLYVIDGVPLDGRVARPNLDANGLGRTPDANPLNFVNAADIASMEVLKDASATAIYGSRGSNGVIIIKTRRAKTGKPEFNFSTYMGIAQKPKLVETVIGAEERRMKREVMELYNQSIDNESLPMMLTDSLNPAFNNATDWQGMFYKTGILNNYDLAVAGATDAIHYRLSLGHYKEDGIVKNTGFKRYSVLGTVGAKVTPWLTNLTRFRYSRTDRPRNINERTGSFFAFSTYTMPSLFMH